VKVRGVRVDLSAVEGALRSLDGIRNAAVQPWRTAANDAVVVAYVVGRDDLDPSEMRTALRARFSGPAIPGIFVRLAELPTTTSGKVDRQALPDPDHGISHAQDSVELTGPEETVLQIFNSVIRGIAVGPDDELLDVGGQSIEAAQIAMRISALYGVEVPLRILLERSSPRAVAAHLDRCLRDEPPRGREKGRVQHTQDGMRPAGLAMPAPAAAAAKAPASYAQLRFWAMQQRAPDTPQLHYVWAQRLSGATDIVRLEMALREATARHPALRTRFITAGTDLNQAFDVETPVNMKVTDRTGSGDVTLAAALADVAAWAAKPFAFGEEALLRARWIQLGNQDGLFALTGHVVVSDGWTKSVLLGDLASAYAQLGGAGGLDRTEVIPPAQASFAEFARRERHDAARRLERYAPYWQERIGDFFDRPRLPFDKPALGRPAVSSGESIAETLPPDRAQALRSLARRWRLSTTALTSAAMLSALWWWSGEPDPAIQVPVPNRPGERYERVVGCFTDEVLVREHVLAGQPFADLAARVHASLFQALDNAVPYEALIGALHPGIDRHDPALTPMMFAPQPRLSRSFTLPRVVTEEHQVDLGTSVWPLQLYLYDTDAGMLCLFSFGTNAFSRQSAERLTSCYVRLLRELAADPDRAVGVLLRSAAAARVHVPASAGRLLRREPPDEPMECPAGSPQR